MADYDSSLPVRTNTAGDVVSKICDGTTITQLWNIDTNGIGQVNLNDGTNALVIGTGGEVSAIITDGTTPMSVNLDGSINVNLVTALSGGEIHVYGTTTGMAPNTPAVVVTHTVTAFKTFQLKTVEGAASGAFKMEVKVAAASKAVAFGSTAGGTVQVHFDQPIEVTAGVAVTLTFTNRDKANMDVYGFINGVEV
jgi:hypothetical protein